MEAKTIEDIIGTGFMVAIFALFALAYICTIKYRQSEYTRDELKKSIREVLREKEVRNAEGKHGEKKITQPEPQKQ